MIQTSQICKGVFNYVKGNLVDKHNKKAACLECYFNCLVRYHNFVLKLW